jgi:hypothetical protein
MQRIGENWLTEWKEIVLGIRWTSKNSSLQAMSFGDEAAAYGWEQVVTRTEVMLVMECGVYPNGWECH